MQISPKQVQLSITRILEHLGSRTNLLVPWDNLYLKILIGQIFLRSFNQSSSYRELTTLLYAKPLSEKSVSFVCVNSKLSNVISNDWLNLYIKCIIHSILNDFACTMRYNRYK